MPYQCPDLPYRQLVLANQAGIKFVGNMTYVHTRQGFIYLATVIGCYSKKVVGWAIDDHRRAELLERALRNAAGTTHVEPNAIWHSDMAALQSTDTGAAEATEEKMLLSDLTAA